MPKLLDEIHPGENLLEDFMKPMGISARRLAADIDVSQSRISELVNGQRPITADTALRLGPGDEIRTELSCKYTRRSFASRLAGTGLQLDRWFTDPEQLFASALLRKNGALEAA